MVETNESTVLIPAGAFIMGTDIESFYGTILKQCKYAKPDEAPIHGRHLEAYRIDKYPVTNTEYAVFVRETGHPPPSHWIKGEISPKDEDKPVIQVNWFDCQSYAEWIGKRLPTEAEWEKAARGPDGRIYPWGDIFNPDVRRSRFALNEDSIYFSSELTPIGTYDMNISPYGVCDIVGGVWEWTSDTYQSYTDSQKKQSQEKYISNNYVLRGGSWLEERDGTAERYYRCANRLYSPPDYMGDNIGFRCVQDIKFSSPKPVQIKIEQIEEYIQKKKLNHLHIIKKRSRKNSVIDTLIALSLILSSVWGSIRKPEWIFGGITFGIIGLGFLFTAGVNYWRLWYSMNRIRQFYSKKLKRNSQTNELDSQRKDECKPTF